MAKRVGKSACSTAAKTLGSRGGKLAHGKRSKVSKTKASMSAHVLGMCSAQSPAHFLPKKKKSRKKR